MTRIVGSVLVASALVLTSAGAETAAALPPDHRVEYRIRETPTDPQSDVIWKVELIVEANEVRGRYVGWAIASITLTQFDEQGDVWRVWQEATPEVPTSDGLWWVEHAAPNSPVAIEFALPPYLVGTADPQTGTQDDLDYEFDGVPYDPPPAGPPFEGRTAAITYAFIILPQPPIDWGDDEPVEVYAIVMPT